MELATQFLRDTLKSVLIDCGFDSDSKYETEKIEAHLLMSSLYRVTVRNNSGKIAKKFIFKALRQEPEINDKFNTVMFFKNEIAFYTKVLPAFEKFQCERFGSDYKPFQSIPKCYKAVYDENNAVVVLEDQTAKGFIQSNKLKMLDYPEVLLLVKELGRFHALSLAMKYKAPETFAGLKLNSVKETAFRTDFIQKRYNEFISFVASWVLKLAKKNFPPNSSYISKLETFASENMAFVMKDIISPKEEDEQYNVITHGDLWVNNLLFHYQTSENDVEKKPDQICFVDFQQCRYGSLALDVSAVLFLFMDQGMRNSYRDDVLHVYHNSLSEFLRHLNCDPDQIFPYDDLESQLSKYALFNLGMSFICLVHNLVEEGDEDMCIKQGPLTFDGTTEECRTRILELIKESVDRCYLG